MNIPLDLTTDSPVWTADGSVNLLSGLGEYVRRCKHPPNLRGCPTAICEQQISHPMLTRQAKRMRAAYPASPTPRPTARTPFAPWVASRSSAIRARSSQGTREENAAPIHSGDDALMLISSLCLDSLQILGHPTTRLLALIPPIRTRGRLLRPHQQARRRLLQPLGGWVLPTDRGLPWADRGQQRRSS